MQSKALLILVYAVVLFVGGIIGMVKAGSLISLFVSAGFATVLLFCAFLIWKDTPYAYTASLVLLTILLLFFVQRFAMSFKTPPGAMMVVTAVTMWYLIFKTPTRIKI